MGVLDQAHKRGIKIEENGEELVELAADEFILQPIYFEWNFSDDPRIFLRAGVVEKLRLVNDQLKGFKLMIWDGFRTIDTQGVLYKDYLKRLKEVHPDWSDQQLKEAVEIFVSFPSLDPLFPAPHNTGGSVDLTLVDENGVPLPMGTDFDEFSERAFTDYFTEGEFYKNRLLLRSAMEGVGFVNYPEEWWHFSFGDQAWAAALGMEKAIYGSVEI